MFSQTKLGVSSGIGHSPNLNLPSVMGMMDTYKQDNGYAGNGITFSQAERVENELKEEDHTKTVHEVYTHVPLFAALKPLLMSMKLVGLFHERDCSWPDRPSSCPKMCSIKKCSKKRNPVTFSSVYSLLITVLIGLNWIRIFTIFNRNDTFGPALFNKVIFLVWVALNFTTYINMFYCCQHYQCFPGFFLQWNKLQADPYVKCLAALKKKVIMYTVICWLLITLNCVFYVYCMWYTSLFTFQLSPFPLDHPHLYVVKILNFGLVILHSCAWIFQPALAFCISVIIQHEFAHFNADFRSKICVSTGIFSGDIEWYRGRHQGLCKLIGHADCSLMLHIGVVFVTQMTLVLLLLYNLLNMTKDERSDIWVMVMIAFWLVAALVQLTYNCLSGALVNHVAHAIWEDVFNINMAILSEKCALRIYSRGPLYLFGNEFFTFVVCGQLSMLTARLNGPPIGLSAMGMFIIDKPMILTMFGLLISYFVLMIQFSPVLSSTGSQSTLCNGSQMFSNVSANCGAQ